jgi:hypothetical protein
MRAFMYDQVQTWLEEGGAIPDDDELYEDLIGIETLPDTHGIVRLKSKEAMKKDGIPSPNRGDALALSFARPVVKKRPAVETPYRSRMHEAGGRYTTQDGEYNPYG